MREGDDAIGIGNRVGITIYDPKGLTLEEHVAERQKHLVSTSEEFPEVKKIFMGENNRIEALRLDYHTRGLGRVGIIVFLLHDGRPYEFSYFAGPSCNEDIHEAAVLLRILSTFKFTK